MSIKSLTPLLAFSFLIGCDGEESKVAPSKDSPDKATSEALSYGSLDKKEQAVNTIPDSFQRVRCGLDLEKKTHIAMMAEAEKMGIMPKKLQRRRG